MLPRIASLAPHHFAWSAHEAQTTLDRRGRHRDRGLRRRDRHHGAAVDRADRSARARIVRSATGARRARVVALGDCVVCHTSKDGKPFAGGLPLATPFGTIYATNITPDPETGIGRWSRDAFARALRTGIGRNGQPLYPAFPYIHFTKMSDDDVAAAYAYLMTREPVHATAPANDLIFPLNFRPLVAFWNVLFLREGAYQPDPRSPRNGTAAGCSSTGSAIARRAIRR